jgi:hypothetical protein
VDSADAVFTLADLQKIFKKVYASVVSDSADAELAFLEISHKVRNETNKNVVLSALELWRMH